jgi:regulator of protease activity HflC (stomatin/prohibitin superfamily)
MPKWIVREYQRGLHYDRGRFAGVLEAGRYRYWRWQGQHIDIVDMRETSQTVEGQEILTSDKIGVRITLIAQFRVTDPVAARHAVDNYASQLYQDLQLTLRDAVTSQSLEELLKSRDALSTGIQEEVAKRARVYGVELSRVGVKDIILPGSVRSVFLQEMEAELKGRANLVAARHELAAARAKANTAKMLRENPHLVRMQELEVLTNLASKSGNVIVIPGLENLFSRTPPEPPSTGEPTTTGDLA